MIYSLKRKAHLYLLKKIPLNDKWMSTLLLIVVAVGFICLAYVGLDPDYEWHLESGKHIIENGIAKEDPFSYSMPSFPFIDHEWITNVLLYTLDSLSGKFLASVFYTGILVLTVFVLSYTTKTKLPKKIKHPIIISLAVLFCANVLPYFGVRPQVISWFFLAILSGILLEKRLWKKYKWFIPLLVLVWVNVHGSFATSIVVMLIVFVSRIFRTQKLLLEEIAILFVSLFATFANPYGLRIWTEVWMQVSDTNLRFTIIEWFPLLFFPSMQLAFFISISAFFLVRYFKRFVLEEKLLVLFFASQAFLSTRHLPLFAVLAIPLIMKSFEYLYNEVKGIEFAIERFSLLSRGLVYCMFVVLFFPLIMSIYQIHDSVSSYYPTNAVSFIKIHHISGEIFAQYGWGGYLIHSLPGKKVYIDGRMPSWRWSENPENEASWAFRDYTRIVTSGKYEEEFFEKYGIERVLWPKESVQTQKPILSARLIPGFVKNKFPYFSISKPFTVVLEENGWKKVYEDSVAVVYDK